VNTVATSFNTIMGQITEISQWKRKRVLSMNSRFGAIYVDVYSLKIYLHFTLALYKFMNGCQYW